jgi:hypothetical protein
MIRCGRASGRPGWLLSWANEDIVTGFIGSDEFFIQATT